MKDAEWIADLVRHGLIAKSFVPPKPLRELRELLRYRRKLTESQAAERNRLQKLLETANIKLASVASDVFGVSGRAMLRALIAGEASPEAMAVAGPADHGHSSAPAGRAPLQERGVALPWLSSAQRQDMTALLTNLVLSTRRVEHSSPREGSRSCR